MQVPEQFTHTPNEYKAPWYHQIEGKPTRYINPEYRQYVARRDAKITPVKVRPKSQVMTKTCMVCKSKFPTTSETEMTCGNVDCRKAAASAGYVSVYPTCVICRRAFQGMVGEVTCSNQCERQYQEHARIATNRYRSLRPRKADWDWEAHQLMEQLIGDPDCKVVRYECVVCEGITYTDPRMGRAYSCSPEHELERRLRRMLERDGEGIT